MPVIETKTGVRLRANNVYVITPGVSVEFRKGVFFVSKRKNEGGVFHPVSILFRSLAEECGTRSIGVVLSGTATDGTEGLLAIKEAGGFTFAQDASATYQGMPQSAIESGAVDFILPPREIGNELLRIAKHPHTVASARKSPSVLVDDVSKILSYMHSRFGLDFAGYKQAMVRRRIDRRMVLARQKTLLDYARYLRDTKGEDQALHQDLLINVTTFFRDTELFRSLARKVLPALLRVQDQSHTLRVWVPACSTGEEVYSIAITIAEILERSGEKKSAVHIKIFGTDADHEAIEKARIGMYPKALMHSVSAERLARFFRPVNGSYQVNKSLREMCVFSPHNFLKDPPFSRMDLISCQNVLIYLDTNFQKKALRAFHYALKPSGYLVLGKSETVGPTGDMFEVVEKKHKIYKRKVGSATKILVPDTSVHVPFGVKKEGGVVKEKTVSIEGEADELLLRDFTPASMVVNSDMDIVRFRGATSPYLEPSTGNASLNLLKMVRQEFTLELRTLLHKAKKEGQSAKKSGIPSGKGRASRLTTIEVVPLKVASQMLHFLVLFSETEVATGAGEEVHSKGTERSDPKSKRIEALVHELSVQKEQMKSMNEEYEAANEELQSANEEVLSSNEELQSINEELETSQEELQSTNEELTTTNDELGARNKELGEARDYAEGIVETVRQPLLVLTNNLRVRTANEAFYKAFKVTREDTEGHLIFELGNNQWDIPSLRKLLSEIIYSSSSIFQDFEMRHTFQSIGEKVMLLNAHRLFQKDNKEKLILLAIEDITERRQAETRKIEEKRLEEIARAKDEFLDMASHELRTPVASIKGYTQILERQFTEANDTRAAKLVSKLDRQVDNLTALIFNLFDDIKIKEGKLKFQKEYFDFNMLVANTIEEVQYMTKQHKITGTFAKIPNVYGDSKRIKQVISNLLTNAIKYSPGAKRVKVVTKTSGQSVIVSVQDFGIGISKKDQSKIFTQFYRVRTKDLDTHPGLGLGLYIATNIIEGHGGRIEVKSNIGKGSVFYVTFPIKEQSKKI